MGEPVKVQVVGQALPGSIVQLVGPEGWANPDTLDSIERVAGHGEFLIAVGISVEIASPPPQGVATKRMSVAEFRALGLLQEVNRRLLHPLGLKLGWQTGMDDDVLTVWDDRGDPEGVRFEGIDLATGAAVVDALWEQRRPAREAALGYMVQPPNDEPPAS